jgi:hypothetical protein
MFPSSELRFRAGVVLVAVATVIIGLAVWSLWPDPAEKEFARAALALASVRSFRYDYADLGPVRPNRELHEIVCPSRQRLTILSGGGTHGTFEYIHVEGRSFHRTPQSGGWWEYADDTGPSVGLDPRVLCERLTSGKEGNPFPPYSFLLKRGFPERGDIKQVEGGGECREWRVQVPPIGTQDYSESFCLDTKTHLPLYRLTGSGHYSFSAFNEPLSIEAPRVTGMTY